MTAVRSITSVKQQGPWTWNRIIRGARGQMETRLKGGHAHVTAKTVFGLDSVVWLKFGILGKVHMLLYVMCQTCYDSCLRPHSVGFVSVSFLFITCSDFVCIWFVVSRLVVCPWKTYCIHTHISPSQPYIFHISHRMISSSFVLSLWGHCCLPVSSVSSYLADMPANKLVVALPLCLDGLYLPSNTSRFLTLPSLDHLLKRVLVILSASHSTFIVIVCLLSVI